MVLRKLMDAQLRLTEPGKPLHRLHPLVSALDTFLFEPKERTTRAPHIRDAVDTKRWMMIVVFALLPCILMAIWNTGMQKFVYASGDFHLMEEFFASCHSLRDYFSFAFKDDRYQKIVWYGLEAFIPVMVITYAVGGLVEGIFACIRGHDIAEGFLVTGMLYALIMPPTIPYWMVAFGVAFGVLLSKELFGGTGMNIVNPALASRAILFFAFPAKMSGNVWVGTNPTVIRDSLTTINRDAGLSGVDAYTQASPLGIFNASSELKRIHIDAIATTFKDVGQNVPHYDLIQEHFTTWSNSVGNSSPIGELSYERLAEFLTGGANVGGLELSSASVENAYAFSELLYGQGVQTDWNFFLGNKIGSMGETSGLACLLGALFLICTKVGSWRTILGMVLGGFITALIIQSAASFIDSAWSTAQLTFPAYKHLLMGGFLFGAVFMATDPVSSPTLPFAKWIYGFFVGFLTIFLRCFNPAWSEGVMLAILTGNIFSPLIEHVVLAYSRRRYYACAERA